MISGFDTQHYQSHNAARLAHLASLGLPLSGRKVIEVGAGPGNHTTFYLERGCEVTITDGRPVCVKEAQARYPGVKVALADLNQPMCLASFGKFEVVHAYGVLYHLSRPDRAIESMAMACAGMLLLETCVSFGVGEEVNLVSEIADDPTQSCDGVGCRPTRGWVFGSVSKHFPFVYQTRTQPDHPEFPTDWSAPKPGLSRIVLVASREALSIPSLSPTILDRQEKFG
jgi:SAM-dependent methyltransferase